MAFDRSGNLTGFSNTTVLPVVNGGTGASTVEGAKTNLGLSGITSVNGNVGIGTSSPATLLTVSSGGTAGSNATGTGTIQIRQTSSSLSDLGGLEFVGSTFGSGYGYKWSAIDSSGVNLVLASRENSVTWTEKMRIDASGNVGIGTSSPAQRLQVGDGNADTRASFRPNSAFAIGIANGAGFAGWIGGSGTTDNMVFSNSGGTERMRIDSSGNVGIGTSSPARPLHVSDVMRLEPRNGAPSSPAKGDIYFDSADDKLKCYDGANWQNLF